MRLGQRGRASQLVLCLLLVAAALCGASFSFATARASSDALQLNAAGIKGVTVHLAHHHQWQQRGAVKLAETDASGSSANPSPPAGDDGTNSGSSRSSASSSSQQSTPTTTTTTTTTTSSRAPNPVTTPAPKIAQWTGIAVAILITAALITGLVLCKLRAKEQCCFRPRHRGPPSAALDRRRSRNSDDDDDHDGSGYVKSRSSRRSWNSSASPPSSSSSPSGSPSTLSREPSFHEATVADNGRRRSLLDMGTVDDDVLSQVSGNFMEEDDDEEDYRVPAGIRPGVPRAAYRAVASPNTAHLDPLTIAYAQQQDSVWSPLEETGADGTRRRGSHSRRSDPSPVPSFPIIG